MAAAEQGQAVMMDPTLLDDIIRRLTEVRSTRPGKQVQLSETEIKQLCVASGDIFVQQPNLIELEAPIKICSNFFEFFWVKVLIFFLINLNFMCFWRLL